MLSLDEFDLMETGSSVLYLISFLAFTRLHHLLLCLQPYFEANQYVLLIPELSALLIALQTDLFGPLFPHVYFLLLLVHVHHLVVEH